jgi:DNA-binding phage protein
MKAPRDVSYEDTLLPMLKDPVEAAAYVEAVLELDDPAALLVALRHVAKAHGMAEVARRADMGDKTLRLSVVPELTHA